MKRFSLFIALMACIFFDSSQGIAAASERETELFNKGYEYLFSYKPDKAAETFRVFLKEFPESSARDAAMFWLGKTLINLKMFSEAELTFQGIQKEFPDSPFIVFIDVEMEEIAKLRSAASIKQPSELQKHAAERETKDDKKAAGRDNEVLAGELNAFKKKVNELQSDNTALAVKVEELERQAEQRIRDMKILNSYLTKLMFQKKEPPKQQPDPKVEQELEKLKAAIEQEKRYSAELSGQVASLKEQRREPPPIGRDIQPPSRQTADAVVMAGKKTYPLSQVIDYQTDASLLFRRLEVREPAWRVGNVLDDFIAEDLLLQEAIRTGIKIDPKKQKEVIEKYRLTANETKYLEKLTLIARYIDSVYNDGPKEQWIELIAVDYKPGDAASKTGLATEIQKAAREGKSFEEIVKAYADGIRFSRLSLQEFSTQYKDKSQILQKLNFINEETVVIWSDKGYMLIKPTSGRLPFNPFEGLAAEKKAKFDAFLKQWLAEHNR